MILYIIQTDEVLSEARVLEQIQQFVKPYQVLLRFHDKYGLSTIVMEDKRNACYVSRKEINWATCRNISSEACPVYVKNNVGKEE